MVMGTKTPGKVLSHNNVEANLDEPVFLGRRVEIIYTYSSVLCIRISSTVLVQHKVADMSFIRVVDEELKFCQHKLIIWTCK